MQLDFPILFSNGVNGNKYEHNLLWLSLLSVFLSKLRPKKSGRAIWPHPVLNRVKVSIRTIKYRDLFSYYVAQKSLQNLCLNILRHNLINSYIFSHCWENILWVIKQFIFIRIPYIIKRRQKCLLAAIQYHDVPFPSKTIIFIIYVHVLFFNSVKSNLIFMLNCLGLVC